MPLDAGRRLIREKTVEALRRRKEIPLVSVPHPVTLRWDYLPKGALRTYDPAFKPAPDPRRVVVAGDSVERLFFSKK